MNPYKACRRNIQKNIIKRKKYINAVLIKEQADLVSGSLTINKFQHTIFGKRLKSLQRD